jgi:alcohol dehydrogenase
MMPSFTFSIPTQIQFGPDISRQAGTVTKSLVASNGDGLKTGALVIIDPGIKSADWVNDILASIEESGVQHLTFDEVKPNPRDDDVHRAASLLEKGFGAIVAIGGGSTIDTAKTAALLATHGGKVSDYAGWAKVPGPVLPVVAIPTTAGSGSEATCWAVITDSRSHNKLAIGDRHLAPAVALVDPALTLSLPASLTAATGMDVLTHAIEAYLSAVSSPVNDLLALEAIRLVAGNLPQVVTRGDDLEAREAMMLASTLGGIVINNADVAGVHCLSESMGSLYDAPHGLLNAILLPYFMAFWQSGCEDRFANIAAAFGAVPNPEEAVARVIVLNQWLKFPSLVDIGVKQQDLQQLAETAAANVSNSSNPVPMAASDYLGILEQAMTGQLIKADYKG